MKRILGFFFEPSVFSVQQAKDNDKNIIRKGFSFYYLDSKGKLNEYGTYVPHFLNLQEEDFQKNISDLVLDFLPLLLVNLDAVRLSASLVEFESPEHLRAWREHPEHREAQRIGRERFYEEYERLEDKNVYLSSEQYQFRHRSG